MGHRRDIDNFQELRDEKEVKLVSDFIVTPFYERYVLKKYLPSPADSV